MQKGISDFYFSSDDSQRFLPWLIGIMATLAALLLCLGITLSSWIISTGDKYSGSFTVNIPMSDTLQDSAIDGVRETLAKTPGIASVSRIENDTLIEMLTPWLGSSDDAKSLPLPVVFDVTLASAKNEAKFDYSGLEKTLSAIAPGTEVDAHERWIAAFSEFSSVAQGLLIILSAVLLGAMGLMIAFTSRASLKLHNKTVLLLHSIGAEDRYITRQFQREAKKLVLTGAAAGCAIAGLTYFGVGHYLASLPSAMLPALPFTGAHIKLLIIMPLACALLAWLVARWSVLRQLGKSL